MSEYTGRKIAIISDIHGLLQPLEAVIEACKKEGITEIYSLGDNIGDGPNPLQVIELLEREGITSIRGNAEEYAIHGTLPFDYIHDRPTRKANAQWTIDQVQSKVNVLKKYPVSIDLEVGGKKVALCHFIGDVRSYLYETSTWSFQDRQKHGDVGSEIFRNVNSESDRQRVISTYNNCLAEYGEDDPRTQIAKSEMDEPLFGGKLPSEYDSIIQGHVHFKSFERMGKTDLYTARGLAFGFTQSMDQNPTLSYDDKAMHGHQACFMVLEERANDRGFDVTERFVSFDRNAMRQAIQESENAAFSPSGKFTEITEKDVMDMAYNPEARREKEGFDKYYLREKNKTKGFSDVENGEGNR